MAAASTPAHKKKGFFFFCFSLSAHAHSRQLWEDETGYLCLGNKTPNTQLVKRGLVTADADLIPFWLTN